MVTKHALYELTSPSEEYAAAEHAAKGTIDRMIAKEPHVSTRSEMGYVYADGSHRFCVAIETEEAA